MKESLIVKKRTFIAPFCLLSGLFYGLLFTVGISLFSGSASAEMVGSIETKGLSFISQDYENTQSSHFGFVGAALKSKNFDEDILRADLMGMYAVGTPVLSYLNVKELYIAYDLNETSRLSFGRKLNWWSDLDDRWNLGFFQPQFRWNPLVPETQGMTGLFWEKKMDRFRLLAFGSVLFIPDQGPGFELKDGQFQSSSPWFTPPPQNIIFQNQLLPIDYQVKTPPMSDILFQPSYGMQLKYTQNEAIVSSQARSEESGFFAFLSGQYKPSHQMAMSYKGVLVTDRVRVDIQPKTYYESVVGLDFGYKQDWGTVLLSSLYIRPQKINFDTASMTGMNYPLLKEAASFGPAVHINVNEKISFAIAGLLTTGGEVTEEGPDTSAQRTALTTKYLYKNAYQIGIHYKDTFRRKLRLRSSLLWLQTGVGQNDTATMKILRFKNQLDIKGPWSLNMDLLLVETSAESSPVATFRNLDQLWIGASYAFE